MDADNQLFVYRVAQIPLVKAACQQAVAVYETTKNSNRLINSTLQMAENSVKKAGEIETVKKLLEAPIVASANKIAVRQLEKLEEKYPSINTTPNELWENSKNYYESSVIKSGVDKVYSAKDYSVSKVEDTKTKVADVLTGLLDYSDGFVDKYIVPENNVVKTRNAQRAKNAAYLDRVQCLSGKVYTGLKYQAANKYDISKQYVAQTLGDFQTAVFLLEYAKNAANWANDKTRATVSTAQEQTAALWQDMQRRVGPFGEKSEQALLKLVQTLAFGAADISDYVVTYSAPYLPAGSEKSLLVISNRAHELSTSFSKIHTLSELGTELINDAKEGVECMKQVLVDAIDYVVAVPPVCWLAVDLDGVEFHEEMLDMNREFRRPGDARIRPLIIEPRCDSKVQSG